METKPTLHDLTILPQPSPPTEEEVIDILRATLGIETFTARLAVKHRPYKLLRGLSSNDAARVQDKLLRRGLRIACEPPLSSEAKENLPLPTPPPATLPSPSQKDPQENNAPHPTESSASQRPKKRVSTYQEKILRSPHPSTAHAYLHPPYLRRGHTFAHTFTPMEGIFHALKTAFRLPLLGSGLGWHLFLGGTIAVTLVFLALLRPMLFLFFMIHPLIVTIALALSSQFFLNGLHTALLDEPRLGPFPSLLALEIWLSGVILYIWCVTCLLPLLFWMQYIDPLLPKGWLSYLPIFALASLPLFLWPAALLSITSGNLSALWDIRSYKPLLTKLWPHYLPLFGVGLLSLVVAFPVVLHIYLGGPDVVYWSIQVIFVKSLLSLFVGLVVAYTQGFMGVYLGSMALLDPSILPKAPLPSLREDDEDDAPSVTIDPNAPWRREASAPWPTNLEERNPAKDNISDPHTPASTPPSKPPKTPKR
ncbi:MAG: hypothetical protein H6727_04630 [Myxococcales bacterium]|nr:hypothetical protein [Myxococcales bacterium]